MTRFFFFTFVLLLGSVPAIAKSTDSAPAIYILQLSSNLNCETFDIELISKQQDIRRYIKFTSGAFAAAEVPHGVYTFGDATCTKKDSAQTFDVLKNKVAPLNLNAGQAYYGGRMTFQKVDYDATSLVPKVLSNCTRVISRARGDTGNECRDGVGVDTAAHKPKMLNVFFPSVTEEDIKTVRTAFSATEEQLLYLPLKE